jgi:hypothetical protein
MAFFGPQRLGTFFDNQLGELFQSGFPLDFI